TGLEMLSRDVASRAFLNRSGPFRGMREDLPSPLAMKAPSAGYRAEIARLFQRMLFRNPTPPEVANAFRFIQGIYRAARDVPPESDDLRFQLTARDGHGRSTTEDIVIPVTSDPHSLYQELIDESLQGPSPTLKRALKQEFTLRANDAGQQFRISNVSTNGNVSI